MAQCSHYLNRPSPTSRLRDAEKTEGRPSSAGRRRVSYLRGRLTPSAWLPLLSAPLRPSVTYPASNDFLSGSRHVSITCPFMILSFHTATILDPVPTISPFENILSNQGRTRADGLFAGVTSGGLVWRSAQSVRVCKGTMSTFDRNVKVTPRIQGAAYHWDTC